MKKLSILSLLVLASCSPFSSTTKATQPAAALTSLGFQYGTVNHLGSTSSFDQALATGAAIVVKFGADWCPPCRQMVPELIKASAELSSVLFIEVNIDSFKNIASRYGVRSIPAVFVFKNGSTVSQTTGYKDSSSLTSFVRSALGM